MADFTLIQDVVRAIRNMRAEKKLNHAQKLSAIFAAGERTTLLESQLECIAHLSKLDQETVQITENLTEPPTDAASAVVQGIAIYLPLAGLIDIDAEKARLEKELAQAQSQINRLKKLLNSPFADKAPANVVENEREKLATFQETADQLTEQLNAIN